MSSATPCAAPSNRTLNGILALYDALVAYARQSNRPVYLPIPLHAEADHIYQTHFHFVHATEDAEERRAVTEELYQTRAANPAY